MKIIALDTASTRHVYDVAKIHKSAYGRHHFTSTFSDAKLVEYNGALISASAITLVALVDDKVVGFAITGEDVSRGVAEFTARNRNFLLKQLLTQPQFLLEKIVQVARSKISRKSDSRKTPYRLLSIAVDPNSQSNGVGKSLINELERLLIQRGIGAYGLSVRKNNKRAIKFYEANGFHVEMGFNGSLYFAKKLSSSCSERSPPRR